MPPEALATSHSPLTCPEFTRRGGGKRRVTASRLPETHFRVETDLNHTKQTTAPSSTRNSVRSSLLRLLFACKPSASLASQMTTHPPELLASPADLVCYSRRRTCVPPLGPRATAPAQPRLAMQWCLEAAPAVRGRRTLPVATASQANRPSPSPAPAVIEAQVKGVCCARAHANGK